MSTPFENSIASKVTKWVNKQEGIFNNYDYHCDLYDYCAESKILDQYISILRRAGYIKRVKKCQYKRIKKISDNFHAYRWRNNNHVKQ